VAYLARDKIKGIKVTAK